MSTKGIIKKILDKRGISSEEYNNFIFPNYDNQQDPFLLPDMNLAVIIMLIIFCQIGSLTAME